MRLALVSFTAAGGRLGGELTALLEGLGQQAEHTCLRSGGGKTLAAWTAERFSRVDGLIFIGAAGIAVRAVAPHLRSKATDPAVVVLDEAARFCIPLVSGHIGGANRLALLLAERTGAQPVITTATDLRGLFAVDSWAVAQGLVVRNPERIKLVSGALLEGRKVRIRTDLPIGGKWPPGVSIAVTGPADVVVGIHPPEGEALWLLPPVVAAGIGCRKGIPEETIRRVLLGVLEREGIPVEALRRVCSIDLKAEEPGLLALCEGLGLPLTTYTAGRLLAVEGEFTSSPFVHRVTGVDNVCERAAVLGSGGGWLIAPKHGEDGVTVALAQGELPLTFEDQPPKAGF